MSITSTKYFTATPRLVLDLIPEYSSLPRLAHKTITSSISELVRSVLKKGRNENLYKIGVLLGGKEWMSTRQAKIVTTDMDHK